MKKLYKLLIICLLILSGGNALKAQSYNDDNSKSSNGERSNTYISKIAVAYGAKKETPIDILKNNGFTVIDKDLNAGCGSTTHYIYMGYKTSTNPDDAITGIFIRDGEDTPDYDYFDDSKAYLLGGETESNPGEDKPVDLNIDAGGATLHVYVCRSSYRAAVTDIKFSNKNSMTGYVTPNVDLNKDAGGEYIYLHYKQYSASVYATFNHMTESGQSVSTKSYATLLHHLDEKEVTPPSYASWIQYDDRSYNFVCWKDNTDPEYNDIPPDPPYIVNLETSGKSYYGWYYTEDWITLKYDANGGSGAPSDQSAKLQLLNAGNGSPILQPKTFYIPSDIYVKEGFCKFLGWSTNPNASSAEYLPGQNISITLNTTIYAIYDTTHEYVDGFCTECGHSDDSAELVDGYYQIKTADHLFWFAKYVNLIDRTASAKLMNDIDLENRPWTPIGFTGESNNNFCGHFNGNGKTITGLNVNEQRNGLGFFGEVRLGTVENFTIHGNVYLNGKYDYVGGVIGSAPGANSNQPDHNGATIHNITSYVNVALGEGSHGSNFVAGFIGYANHETLIENCTWYGTLDLGPYRAQDGVGGLVGKANKSSSVSIRNCAAYGTIKTSYKSGTYNNHNTIFIGGIVSNSVAEAQTTLENCIWAGTLVNDTDLGEQAHISAIGTLNGTKSVTNCYALDNMPYVTTNNEHNTGISSVTEEQLASGEIAYKLQGTQDAHIWGQNIDNGKTADAKPILGGAKVYEYTLGDIIFYSNNNTCPAGQCGENLYWYVANNTLTIYGTGAMYDYGYSSNISPWRNLNTAPTSLVLEEGITHIGNWAFENCKGLNGSLTIPNSVTSIGNYAFDGCSGFTGSLTIPNSVTTIGNYAFYNCYGFTGSLTIPNSVTTIGNYAFSNCSGFTGSLTIPNSVTSIGNEAFSSCYGFTGSLTIGNSVTTIGNYAFSSCSGFTSLTIPNSVTSIGKYAFSNCSGFTGSLTIGNSVTSIGSYAFRYCSGLSEIFFYRDTNPTISSNTFNNLNSSAKIYAPVIWSSFTNIPEDKLVKMATFVGQQTTDASTGSATVNGWVFPEGMTEVGENDHVAINAPMVISGQQSAVSGQQSANSLSVKSFGLCGNENTTNGSITIEDGAQLYCEVARGEVTVKKEILGYQQSAVSSQQSESESKWYTIASPLKDTLQISDPQFLNSSVPQFLSSNSDLYRYDEPTYTWQNAKNSAENGFNCIEPGRGYLYANANDTVLEFTGMINTDEVTYNLTTDADVLTGFHLVGNPFTHNITFAHLNAIEDAELVNGYYVLNGEGAWGVTLGSNEDDVIKVGQGVLVKAKSEGRLAISRQPSAVSRQRSGKGQQTTDNGQQSLCISVSNAKYSDRAFVVFDKGVGLDKMNHENENIPLLYIPMEDTDYAIAMMDINVNEIPVNFETNVMGQYTISLQQKNCEFDELYLYDKVADVTVNILAEDYSFIATSNDTPERFVLLMMNDNSQQTTDNSPWVYVNNGDVVITNISGNANIRIFDAMGRCVYQGESSDETTRIANRFNTGVYVIQKVDDNGVKVQKLMID